MNDKKYLITLVIPAHNEEDNIFDNETTLTKDNLITILVDTFIDGLIDFSTDDDEVITNNRGNFYGVDNRSSITFIFNDQPSVSKNYNTISYEGGSGWQVELFQSDLAGMDFKYYLLSICVHLHL